MTQFFYWLGELFQTTFLAIPILGNYFNLFLVILFSIAFLISLKKFI